MVTNTHKTIGITVLGLALMRLLWRIGHRPPPFSPAIPRWQVAAARTVTRLVLHHPGHAALRMDLRFGMGMGCAKSRSTSSGCSRCRGSPGWPTWRPEPKKALDEFAHNVHEWLSYLLYVLLAAHLIGAFKHQWFDHVPTLQRMTFRGAGGNDGRSRAGRLPPAAGRCWLPRRCPPPTSAPCCPTRRRRTASPGARPWPNSRSMSIRRTSSACASRRRGPNGTPAMH